jgi:hypothetical protein
LPSRLSAACRDEPQLANSGSVVKKRSQTFVGQQSFNRAERVQEGAVYPAPHATIVTFESASRSYGSEFWKGSTPPIPAVLEICSGLVHSLNNRRVLCRGTRRRDLSNGGHNDGRPWCEFDVEVVPHRLLETT